MKWIISSLFFLTLTFTPDASYASSLAEPTSPRNIQILLEKDASEALLEVKGPYYLLNPQDGSRIASGLLGKRFLVHQVEKGLKWGEEFPGIFQFYVKPRSQDTAIFVNGIQYSGAIAVFAVGGAIHIVNDLNIEEYVKSVLTSQFQSSMEPEVLSALAILARTDAYYQATRSPNSFWHISGPETKYTGSALIVPDSPIQKAVDSTKHLILVHPDHGRHLPFATSWTEHSAGKTIAYETLFRKEAFSLEKGVEAPHAALVRQDTKWTFKISKKNLARLLDLDGIQHVEPFVDPTSNKVYGVRFQQKNGEKDLDFITLQNLLGAKNLQSSDFTLSIQGDDLFFTGFGKGHGVGLCIYSATALAQNGENAMKILSKFFPETYLYNINTHPQKPLAN